ncbi:hypothetical protein C8A03DRAFT_44287 [Achaetomium macrosporum]|uniref:Uncharacterized protein n=1 Tax=Achaetomium macrosporum TaxID=79813 RepID=A0AAN7CAR4_9PEZI|nr:hypothetical protein C8A03DRAFT_44287 [Achaetomium macrosporum]
MESSSRSQGSASSFEADSTDLHLRSKMLTVRMLDTARVGTTALALLMGLTILGVSANTLRVYQETHVSPDFLLPLWPDEFNIRPTVSLVIGSTIVLVSNIVALCFSQVRPLRARATAHTSVTFLAPLVGLTGALIAVVFYYVVNASETTDTFLSWTCRWKDVSMSQQPHWNTLCHQSHAGLYLAILLIPVEVVALGLAARQMQLERYTDRYLAARKTPVPA